MSQRQDQARYKIRQGTYVKHEHQHLAPVADLNDLGLVLVAERDVRVTDLDQLILTKIHPGVWSPSRGHRGASGQVRQAAGHRHLAAQAGTELDEGVWQHEENSLG